MSQDESPAGGSISLEQLIALNEEIAALVRAGVPLERSLAALGGDMPGGLGAITRGLAERMERGETLAEVLAEPTQGFPPVYQAVIQAGLKAGRLPAALESLAVSARRLAETRRAVASAFVYPLLVVLVAWGFFLVFVLHVAPLMAGLLRDSRVPGVGLLDFLASLGPSAIYWGPMVPLLVLILGSIWWWRASRAMLVDPGWSWAVFGWLPWVGDLVRLSRIATFSEILSLLVEHRVPLGESLELAAKASGDGWILRAAQTLAERIERGTPLSPGATAGLGFPPLLAWLLAAGKQHGVLAPALRHAAQTYRDRAQHQACLAATLLPVVLIVVIGGSVTLLYTMTLFAPYAAMLKALSGS